jgi:hypothetical protein
MGWSASTVNDLYSREEQTETLPLQNSELKVFSQNGEDGVIFEIFKRIGSPRGNTFLEFGAETGYETCSRVFLEYFSWAGLFIEADPEKFEKLNQHVVATENIKLIREFVSVNNINKIIKDNFDQDPDMIVIDIDGLDYQIFDSISANPKLFVVEYNAQLPLEASLVNPTPIWDGSANFGASLAALEKIAAKRGYTLAHTDLCGVNAFFIRNDFIDKFPERKNPARRTANYYLAGEQYLHPNLDIDSFERY